jgi:hypothetical protein
VRNKGHLYSLIAHFFFPKTPRMLQKKPQSPPRGHAAESREKSSGMRHAAGGGGILGAFGKQF